MTGTPKFKGIKIVNLYAEGNDVGWHLNGLPEFPILGLYLENITVNIKNKDLWPKCHYIDGFCDSATVKPECPPCLNNEGLLKVGVGNKDIAGPPVMRRHLSYGETFFTKTKNFIQVPKI